MTSNFLVPNFFVKLGKFFCQISRNFLAKFPDLKVRIFVCKQSPQKFPIKQLPNKLVRRINDPTKATKGNHDRNLGKYTTLHKDLSTLFVQKHVKQ